eukprot:TRINITY_DN3811_c0_g1_i11.p2 TRINITY_DN3811_c0_g1~~TRINITY_DN3811_c0_g1_i11.p2  ORF type:complete len:180 (-),score=69.09 TRINITY_DN3811_c0_g1_i11:151-690(-)
MSGINAEYMGYFFAKMSGWDQYINGMIMNKQLPDGTWLQSVVQEAAIVSFDGVLLAVTPGFELKTYDYDIQVDDVNKKSVKVDEKEIFLALAKEGNSKASEAGIRINNVKYMLASYNPDMKLAYLSKAKGGACIMCTKSVIVYAAYSTDLKMSNGVAQSAGTCNNAVDSVAQLLISNGA